jgi:hypothetical protein
MLDEDVINKVGVRNANFPLLGGQGYKFYQNLIAGFKIFSINFTNLGVESLLVPTVSKISTVVSGQRSQEQDCR